MIFLFDLDGTLCERGNKVPSKIIDLLSVTKDVNYLITGTTMNRVYDQFDIEPLNIFNKIFSCHGNHIRYRSPIIDWRIDEKNTPIPKSDIFIDKFFSKYNDFEMIYKPGFVTVKFSKEIDRNKICDNFNKKIPYKRAFVCGKNSIDIMEYGMDKSQIIKYLPENENIIFFGDETQRNGGDYVLSEKIKSLSSKNKVYKVNSLDDTFNKMEEYNNAKSRINKI